MSEHVAVSDNGAVRLVRMNRADKKNAITGAMYDAMAQAFEAANSDNAIRCVVIAGVPGAFCAGNDLGDFLKAASAGEGLSKPILRFLYALARLEKPLVAAVQGVAVGVGTTMLLHCDQAVASDDSRFSTPFVSLGVVPEAASSLLAPNLMGQRRAFSLLVMGEVLSASDAKDAGLINVVVAADQVEPEAMKRAEKIAALPPQAVALSRRLMRGSPDAIVARIDEEAKIFGERLVLPEAQGAFAAFLTRKK